MAIVNPADALVGRSGAPRAAHPPEVSSANLLVSGGACIAARPGVKIPAAHAVDAAARDARSPQLAWGGGVPREQSIDMTRGETRVKMPVAHA